MKFIPQARKKQTDIKVICARVDNETYEKVKNMAKENKIRISNLCRQMVLFALEHSND